MAVASSNVTPIAVPSAIAEKSAVISHPYFSVTATDGVYKIENVPPGEYEITAWHEKLKTQTATVKVDESGTATQDFAYSRPAAGGAEKK